MMERRKDPVRKMAELLKAGATMLAETCPVEGCHLPLFKLPNGEIVCPVHGRIHVVKTDEEAREVIRKLALSDVLERVEDKALSILNDLLNEPRPDPGEIAEWLDVLLRIKNLRSHSSRRD